MAGNDNDCLVFVRTKTDHGIRTVKFKIEWTIQDFILLKDVTKPLTSSPVLCRDLGIDVPGGCWYLTLTPMRKMVLEGESTDCVSLFVARTAQRSAKWPAIHLKGSIGVPSASYTCAPLDRWFDRKLTSSNWGFQIFQTHSELFDPTNKYLIESSLTILAEFTLVVGAGHRQVVSFSTVIRPLVRNDYLETNWGKLLDSGIMSDFIFASSDGEDFPVHRVVLAAQSQVFEAMLTHDTAEGTSGRCVLLDVDGKTLKLLLRYLYTGSVPVMEDSQTAEDLLVVADKYCLLELKNTCVQQLVGGTIAADVAGRLLILADKHRADELKEAVLSYLKTSSTSEAFSVSGGLIQISHYSDELLQEVFQALAGGSKKRKSVYSAFPAL